ncbi:hypothetical protein BO71DRAFT_418445 [Aspergillus ellipticus CBS 707.79]|uniref:Zn(2)-C6 fungal-type domain-containing protein n=1 Tax=Aspergillus ellipticus CBS 707.79 TaxID=1448320 RepID=A0A319DDY6_9EURO|nr:hypothetical protein BO71DRAFT_418445 [Aspergillus ellipticus CBS 707.79]
MAKPTQRHACDRCHGQKLRCIHSERGPCVRCTKAKATCSWSQSLRSNRLSARHKKQSAAGRQDLAMPADGHMPFFASTPFPNSPNVFLNQPPSNDGSNDSQFNLPQSQLEPSSSWVPSRYLTPTSQELPEIQNNQNDGAGTNTLTNLPHWLWPEADNASGHDTSDITWQQVFNQEWAILSSQHTATTTDISPQTTSDSAPKTQCLMGTIRELSELNVELYAHATTVSYPPVSSPEPLTWANKDVAIDQTFQLSQRLIETINKRYPRYKETANDTTEIGSSPGQQIDQGSCLLILSCYTRLIETYDRIFANMQACLDRASVTPPECYVGLPGVQVGSFSMPQSSALQIVTILQLARHLLTRMGELIKEVGPKKDADAAEATPGTGSLLLSGALDSVKPEEDRLMKRINTMRDTLIALNIL